LETADLTSDSKNHRCEGLEIGRTRLKPAPKEPPKKYKELEVRTGFGGSLKKIETIQHWPKHLRQLHI